MLWGSFEISNTFVHSGWVRCCTIKTFTFFPKSIWNQNQSKTRCFVWNLRYERKFDRKRISIYWHFIIVGRRYDKVLQRLLTPISESYDGWNMDQKKDVNFINWFVLQKILRNEMLCDLLVKAKDFTENFCSGVVARVPDSGAGSAGFNTQLSHHDSFFCVLEQDT